jgi:hypothetical protein
MRSRTFWCTAAVAAALFGAVGLVSAPVLAQGKGKAPAAAKPLSEKQKKDAAKKAYKDAEAKFKAGDYAGALPEYRQADALVPASQPKYKIAVCLDKQGKIADAIAAYQAFFDSHPDGEKMHDQIDAGNGRLAALKKTPGKIHINVDPPDVLTKAVVKITVDDKVPENAPEKATFVVPPGHHILVATAEGYQPAKIEFDLKFLEVAEITIPFRQAAGAPPVAVVAPPVAPPPAPPPEPRSKVPAYVTLGLAGAGVVVGTIFGISALSAKSTFDKTPTTDNADTVDRNALISDMSFAIALTFGVTGTVLLLSKGDEAKSASTTTSPSLLKTALTKGFVTPYAGPNGGGAVGTFRF